MKHDAAERAQQAAQSKAKRSTARAEAVAAREDAY